MKLLAIELELPDARQAALEISSALEQFDGIAGELGKEK